MNWSAHPDPRLKSRYVETIANGEEAGTDGMSNETDEVSSGNVTLVGVVHDHPASVFRVRQTVAAVSPDVLALELPPLAIPLYEQYAADDPTPPRFGGEFSAAIQAAQTDTVVGVDGPSTGFIRRLAIRLASERANAGTITDSVRSLLSVTRNAVSCRVAATLTAVSPFIAAVGSSTAYETSQHDPAHEQAADERRQIRTATAVLDAFETSPSSRYRSETREAHMAERIESLGERGDVVAVVGAGHFDPLCERLTGAHDSTE